MLHTKSTAHLHTYEASSTEQQRPHTPNISRKFLPQEVSILQQKDIPKFVIREYENCRNHRISKVENGHIPQKGHGNKSETQHYIWVTLTGTHTNKGTPPQSDSQIIIDRRKTTKRRNARPTDITRKRAYAHLLAQTPRHATGKRRPANSREHLTVV